MSPYTSCTELYKIYLTCILQLLSYAVHRNTAITNGIDSTIESGYSVYVFNSNPSDYCIFDEVSSFLLLRRLLCIAFVLLEISSVFSIPLLLASMYDEFKEKMSSTDNNGKEKKLRYFVWATLILIVPIILLLFCCNGYAIYNGLRTPPTNFNDIIAAFVVMAVAMVVFPVVDTLAAIYVVIRFHFITGPQHEINCFGFPNFANTEGKCIRLKNVIHVGTIVAVTWFTQLALFNCIYVFIGVIAAPVETGSLLLLYITSLFALISFFAVILKVFHKTLPAAAQPREAAQLNNRQVQITYARGCLCFTCLVPYVFLVCVLAIGIGVFVTFMYVYIVLNQEYRNNRGILTFLGALLPSLLASASGLFWTQVMGCIGNKNNTDTNFEERIWNKMVSIDRHLCRIAVSTRNTSSGTKCNGAKVQNKTGGAHGKHLINPTEKRKTGSGSRSTKYGTATILKKKTGRADERVLVHHTDS